MTANHSVSDLVSIINNGYLARKKLVQSPISSLREDVLKILKDEGYILNYTKIKTEDGKDRFNIHLKYHFSDPVMTEIQVVSKPGRRIYRKYKDLPLIRNGLGMVVVSTSKGVISSYTAKTMKLGGEILLKVF